MSKVSNPFIKLFKSPNAFYLFDVNRNDIINISKDAYGYLDKVLHGDDSAEQSEAVANELSRLAADGYLSDKKISIILTSID